MKLGLVDLLKSARDTFCLIVLGVTGTLCAMGKIDGPSFAAVVSSIVLIYNYVSHKVELATMGNDLPPKGSP